MSSPVTLGPLRRWAQAFALPGTRLDNRHVLWLRAPDIAYFRVTKAANSAIRAALALHFGHHRDADDRPWNDGFWLHRPGVSLLGRGSFALHPGTRRTLSFTFVRHPVSRLYSCWNNKLIESDRLLPRFEAMGARLGMSFEAFADLVARSPDETSDIHFRSQQAIVTFRGRVLPGFVGRVETLDADWARLGALVEARGGPHLGPLRARNVRARAEPEIARDLDAATLRLIRQRYRRDFELFYPEDETGL
jgi:hypothetical protein